MNRSGKRYLACFIPFDALKFQLKKMDNS